jgi:hypothetical protein
LKNLSCIEGEGMGGSSGNAGGGAVGEHEVDNGGVLGG